MTKDEMVLRKRLIDLSKQAYQRDIVVFSDFLNLNELNILHSTPKDLFYSQYEVFGGYEFAERQMVAFLPDALYYEYNYPVKVLEFTPISKKYCENLSHRDYLGALMNLGVERCKFGDIVIHENSAYVFTHEDVSDYVIQNITRIKKTSVSVHPRDYSEVRYEQRYEEIKATVASIRLDSMISIAYPMSRSKMTTYIENAKVYVNGKLITNNGYHLKEGDKISIRGLGKISFQKILSKTKKDRIYVIVHKYI